MLQSLVESEQTLLPKQQAFMLPELTDDIGYKLDQHQTLTTFLWKKNPPAALAPQLCGRVQNTRLRADICSADLPDDEATVQLYHERAVWKLLRICFVDTQLAGSVTQVP